MGHIGSARAQTRDRNILALWLIVSCMCVVTATIAAAGQPDAASGSAGLKGAAHCLANEPKTERLRCYEQAAAVQPEDSGAWKLVRSADPRGGPDAVSIMHTAEPSKSDLDIAGLMLRCAGSGIEALVVVIEPRPPRDRPRVTFRAMGANTTFDATVVPPFSALLLPQEAAALFTGPWQFADDLSIQVDGNQTSVHGVVLLAGLRPALDRLLGSCVSR